MSNSTYASLYGYPLNARGQNIQLWDAKLEDSEINTLYNSGQPLLTTDTHNLKLVIYIIGFFHQMAILICMIHLQLHLQMLFNLELYLMILGICQPPLLNV
jgi:hypothetical protein